MLRPRSMSVQSQSLEPQATAQGAGRDARVAWRCVGLGLLVIALLEAWRPFYFLTDDNMAHWVPLVVGIGRNLLSGRSPFFMPQLYGGYDMLRDAGALCFWNPLVLGLSLLGQTPLRLALADIFVGFNLLLAAFCSAHLLLLWRRRLALPLSDRRLMFLALSYAFSAYAIIVGASWGNYMANAASLPLMLLGLFAERRHRGVVLFACGMAHGVLAGHPSPWLFSLMGVCALAAAWSYLHRTPEPLLRGLLGGALMLSATAPLLVLALGGFGGTARNTSFSIEETLMMRVPLPVFIASWQGGPLGALGGPFAIVQLAPGLGFAIVAVAFSHTALSSLFTRGPSRVPGLERVLLGLMLLTALLVVRPLWLQQVLSDVPLVRSLRFPFREVWLFHFWTMLWLALRLPRLSPRAMRLSACSGTLLVALSLLPFGPPSFTQMSADRDALISGRAFRFWDGVRAELPAGSRVLGVMENAVMEAQQDEVPSALLGAYNYPALFDVPGASGYVILGLESGARRRGDVRGPSGMWTPTSARQKLQKEPNLVLMRLQSLKPLAIVRQDRRETRLVPVPK
jgi:hypothetical protein